MRSLAIGILSLLPALVSAYELNGTVTDNKDGSHSVTVENKFGYPYTGTAVDHGDGILDVTVSDGKGGLYKGTAEDIGGGEYEMDLQSDTTGSSANGTLEDHRGIAN